MSEPTKKTKPKRRKILLAPKASPYFLTQEAADYLRLEKNTLVNYRAKLIGPRYRKHGGKVIYHEKDLEEWSDVQVMNT